MYLFDLDGTLIDSTGVWRQIDLDYLARHNIPWTPEYDAGVAHTIFPLAAQFTKEYANLPDSIEEIMAEWHSMAYEAYAYHIPLKPYAREFLEQCREQGIPMALYTSSLPDLCRAALKRHKIDHYFSQIIFSNELGLEKASPEACDAVQRILSVTPSECRLFDDSTRACAAGVAAGWHVTGVYDSTVSGDLDKFRTICTDTILSFEELMD